MTHTQRTATELRLGLRHLDTKKEDDKGVRLRSGGEHVSLA